MKKYILLYAGLFTLILGGCGNKNKMPDFIPTPTVSPTPIVVDTQEEAKDDKVEEEVPIEELDLSEVETTKMYVKMSKYGSTLNVRSKPSTDGDIIGYLVHSEKVEVISIKDGWAAIKDDNMVKYVNSEYLVEEKPEFLQPPTATPTPVPTPTSEPSENVEDITSETEEEQAEEPAPI